FLKAIAHAIDCTGAEIFNHDVGGLGQLPRELALGFVLEIEFYRAAIGIEASIGRGRTAPGWKRVHDEFVRRLDLDHDGAELIELRSRPRRHSAETEINHTDAAQCQARRAPDAPRSSAASTSLVCAPTEAARPG